MAKTEAEETGTPGCRDRIIAATASTGFWERGSTTMTGESWSRSALCLMAIVLSMVTGTSARAETLKEKLYVLDQMRAFDKTPFDLIENEAAVLLKEYPSPEDQALIYFTLAEIYAQSGQRMEKIAAYAEKAVSEGLDPARTMLVYVYWGDSIQLLQGGVGVRGAALAEARRQAVMPYLLGLKVAIDQGVPDQVQEPPILRKPPTGPGDPATAEAERRRYAREHAQWRLIRFHKKLAQYREIHINQIAFMYSRLPFATDELESLARDVLKDDAAVDRLMARVQERIQKRIEALGGGIPDELPKELDAPYSPSATAISGEPSRQDHRVSNGKTEAVKHQEVRSPGTIGEYLQRGNPVLLVVLAVVLVGGLVTGVVVWRYRTAQCRK